MNQICYPSRPPSHLRHLASLLLALALWINLSPALPAQTNFVNLRPDGAWTWYNDPRAVWHNGNLYFGYVRTAGAKSVLSVFNPTNGVVTDLWTSGFSQFDDHNNPGLLARQDGTLLALYARHGTDQTFSYRYSLNTNPVTPADWSGELVIPATGAGVTYANPYQLSGEGGMTYDYARDLNFNPTVFTSADNGVTWSAPKLFIQTGTGGIRPYVKYCSDYAQRIDFLYTDGHPRDVNNSLYHLYYQGGNYYQSDGTLVKSFANLPLQHDSGERGSVIYQYNSAAQTDPNEWIPTGRAWCWEIVPGTNNQPIALFTVQRDQVTGSNWFDDRIYYYYARWTGTNWQKRFIAHAGRPLYEAEDDYAGGLCADPENPNVVYISSNAQDPFNLSDTTNVPLRAGSRYELWRGVTSDGGLTFTWTQITTNSAQDNFRPYIPRRHNGSSAVIWFRGSYPSFTSFACEIVGLFQNPVPVAPQVGIFSPMISSVFITNPANGLVLRAAITNGQPGSLIWTTVSGPTNAIFASATAATNYAVFPLAGSYVLRATAANGPLSGVAEVNVNVGPDPSFQADATRVEWLKFDETSGNTAADASGNGNQGTVSGTPGWLPSGGVRAGALDFNGTNTEVVVPDANSLDNTTAFTLSYWFKARAFTVDSGGLVSKRDSVSVNNAYTTYLKRPDQHIYVDIDGSGDRFASTATINTGLWYHVAVVYDGALPAASRVKFWINGTLDSTHAETSATIPNYGSSFRVGNTQAGTANWFDGQIDDVRFYRRALSDAEVRYLAVTNLEPVVNAGGAPSATSGVAAGLNGNVIDDGKGGPLTVRWQLASGPGAATFANSNNPVTAVTFSQAGPYALRLIASDVVAETFAELSVTVAPNTNVFADWIAAAYQGNTNASVRGPNADPDGDRILNLMEFALGTQPNLANTQPFAAGQPGQPIGQIQTFSGTNYLAMLVRRPIGRLGIGYRVEVSSDLLNWTDAVLVGASPNGDGSETLTYRDTQGVPGSTASFARLVVSPN